MFKRSELYFLDIIYGRQTGFIPLILKGFMRVISWCYKGFTLLRNWAFDYGLFRQYMPPVPIVISIGNITAGGTGKTPTTLMLAKEFYKEHSLAILSRGYRSKAEKQLSPVILCNGNGPLHSASYCGDEPYMLAAKLPKVLFYVGQDRHKSSNMAAKAGAELLILDDGLQHRSLARDFEVVTIDARDPFGQGYFLPRGLLREGKNALKRADLILINKVDTSERFHSLKEQIRSFSAAPIVGTRLEVVAIKEMNGDPVSSIEEQTVAAFCSIAHPNYFYNTLKEQGATVVTHLSIPDHGEFNEKKLSQFAENSASKGAQALICTEKDKVKLPPSFTLPLPIYWLEVQLKIIEEESNWHDFVETIQKQLDGMR